MTVCIGAVSYWHPGGQAVVVASDHMVTMGGFIQYEHETPKIRFVTPKICVMLAGDTAMASSIIERLSNHFSEGQHSTADVALAAKIFYEDFRQEQIISEIFRPRGITMEEFYQGGLQSRLLPQIAGSIDDQVMAYDLNVELLIAGVDSEKAHIYTVSNPGVITNYKHSGYVSIGSGSIHAVQSLIGFGHSSLHSLFETIFTVYASKRRAEVTPGVGIETDLFIITPDDYGWIRLNKQQLSKLDKLYSEFGQPGSAEIAAKVTSLELFETEEENESQTNAASSEKSNNPS